MTLFDAPVYFAHQKTLMTAQVVSIQYGLANSHGQQSALQKQLNETAQNVTDWFARCNDIVRVTVRTENGGTFRLPFHQLSQDPNAVDTQKDPILHGMPDSLDAASSPEHGLIPPFAIGSFVYLVEEKKEKDTMHPHYESMLMPTRLLDRVPHADALNLHVKCRPVVGYYIVKKGDGTFEEQVTVTKGNGTHVLMISDAVHRTQADADAALKHIEETVNAQAQAFRTLLTTHVS